MKLSRIVPKYFRSFGKEQEFKLPPPGLYHLSGANGVGKTTLFEAPYWCLFGKTTNNLKASNIANWSHPSDCNVLIDITAFNTKHSVYRSWKPNGLWLDEVEVDQVTLERKLGLTPETFMYGRYFTQKTDHFLDLKPEAKLSMLVELLRLQLWDKAAWSRARRSLSDH